MNKSLLTLVVLGLLAVSSASAHVSVKPDKVGVGAFQTFTVSVPSERETATTKVRLVLPAGLEFVTPTVKPGWKINTETHVQGTVTHVLEIEWSAGTIPGHFRDEFTFSARVPATAGTMEWKAYQTYSDGSVVEWDLGKDQAQPQKDGKADFSQKGPASVTTIVNDLAAPAVTAQPEKADRTPLMVSTAAIVLSLVALVMGSRKRV